MKRILLYVILLFAFGESIGQSAKYKISVDSVKNVARGKNDVIIPIYIKRDSIGDYRDSTGYRVLLSADTKQTTLSQVEYRLDNAEKELNQLDSTDSSRNTIYL